MAQAPRAVLITGAAGGIGHAAVELFSQQGWDVVAVDRLETPLPIGVTIRADVSQPDEVKRTMAEVQSRFSRLDAVVNNAAEQICKPLVEIQPDEWDRVMASNLRSIYLLALHAHGLLRTSQGCVVNVASIHALATSTGMTAYAASKGAVVSLTRAMALEFSSDGIRVNAVLPGAIDTPMLAAGLRRSHLSVSDVSALSPLQALARRHPLGRVGRAQEVAQAIYFLADAQRSSFITGQTLVVDGGASARLSTE